MKLPKLRGRWGQRNPDSQQIPKPLSINKLKEVRLAIDTQKETVEELKPGTFCPKCGAAYSGSEIVLGRHPKWQALLHPILRCAVCHNHHAWDQEAIAKLENGS